MNIWNYAVRTFVPLAIKIFEGMHRLNLDADGGLFRRAH